VNIQETVLLCRTIASLKPAQAFDVDTPMVWQLVLAETNYADAAAAVITLARTSKWIDPADIINEVRRIRLARLEHSDRIVPDVDPDDVQEWLTAKRAAVQALADGHIEAPPLTDDPIDPRLAAALPSVVRGPDA
jgi:hypothetical protein